MQIGTMLNGAKDAKPKSPLLELLRRNRRRGDYLRAVRLHARAPARILGHNCAARRDAAIGTRAANSSRRPSSSFGEEQVTMVMVVGGLTEEGKRLLSAGSPQLDS